MRQSREAIRAQHILMLGFGATGQAVCEFAIRHSIPVCVSECEHLSENQQNWLRRHGIPFEHAGHTARLLQDNGVMVLSPGVPLELPVIEQARQRDIPVFSEIDFALSHIGGCPIIAVTGTNGKSSTVEMIGQILRSLGRTARVAGNIGIPLISIVDEIAQSDVLVLEISSYQLEQSRDFRPSIGVLLNLSPDHIQRHGDMQSYTRAKGKLFANQGPAGVAILPKILDSQFSLGSGRRVFYDQDSAYLPTDMETMPPHQQSNLLAALAACAALIPEFDVSSVSMDVVQAAGRLPHRMDMVGIVDRVRVINDSKSTNAGSTIAALRATDAPVVLLLGGRHKGAGYQTLVDEIAAADIREVILFGEAAGMLAHAFEQQAQAGVEPIVVPTLSEAATHGLLVAQPGDVLLLSPACSSFDAFSSYAERGDMFVSLIRSLPGFEAGGART